MVSIPRQSRSGSGASRSRITGQAQRRPGRRFLTKTRKRSSSHSADILCREHKIEHRLTKVKHPWSCEDQKTVQWTVFPSGGQVARMNRTIKEATVKRFHDDTHDQLERHRADFFDAYNYSRRLKTLSDLTPYAFICKTRTNDPNRVKCDPCHQMTRLNNPDSG